MWRTIRGVCLEHLLSLPKAHALLQAAERMPSRALEWKPSMVEGGGRPYAALMGIVESGVGDADNRQRLTVHQQLRSQCAWIAAVKLLPERIADHGYAVVSGDI